MNKAIIFGASGLTGSSLLQLLCSDSYYSEVICFVRKQIHVINNKQINVLSDLSNLEQHAALFVDADVYCCIGTTNKNVKNDKNAYREIDLFLPMRIAKSSIFYNRLKG
jgi:putative NADH-flavin reductase